MIRAVISYRFCSSCHLHNRVADQFQRITFLVWPRIHYEFVKIQTSSVLFQGSLQTFIFFSSFKNATFCWDFPPTTKSVHCSDLNASKTEKKAKNLYIFGAKITTSWFYYTTTYVSNKKVWVWNLLQIRLLGQTCKVLQKFPHHIES